MTRALPFNSSQHSKQCSNNNSTFTAFSFLKLTALPTPAAETQMAELPQGFYRTELNKTVWEVPGKYQNLSPIGTGAYGQVW